MNIGLSENLVTCLGWTLLHFLWQGLLFAAGFAVCARVLRSAPANQRYLAGCVALSAMILAPLITLEHEARQFQPPAPAPVKLVSITVPPPEIAIAPIIDQAPPPVTSAKPPILVHFKTTPAPPPKFVLRDHLDDLLAWLVIAWAVGVCALSSRLAVSWLHVKRLKHRATAALAGEWPERLAELMRRLEVSRPVRLFQSAIVEVPTVIGWLRPVILLPASCLAGLSPAQLEAVLAHELAHVRRHDYLVNLVQSAVETLLFYHPAVWWISRRIREERELCCDDLAVRVCRDRVTYARALATLEELRLGTARVAVAAGGAPLLERIRRLAAPPAKETPRSGWVLTLVLALTTVAAVIISLWSNGAAAQGKSGPGFAQSLPGTTNSPSIRPVVTAPPPGSSSGPTLTWESVAGEQYAIQVTTNHLNWASLATLTATGPTTTFVEPTPLVAPSARFYRIMPMPLLATSAGTTNTSEVKPPSQTNEELAQLNLSSPPATASGATNSPAPEKGKAMPQLKEQDQGPDPQDVIKNIQDVYTTSPAARKKVSQPLAKAPGITNSPAAAPRNEVNQLTPQDKATNGTWPQIRLQAKFVELSNSVTHALGFDLPPGGVFPAPPPVASTASDAELTSVLRNAINARTTPSLTEILTDSQYKVVVRALEQRQDVEILTAPEVITSNGLQVQMQAEDVQTIVNGNPATINPTTASLPIGPELDLIAYVSADAFAVQMTVLPSVTEFLGYEDPGQFVVQAQVGAGVPLTSVLPLPHFRVRSTLQRVVVPDGQTLVLVMTNAVVRVTKVQDKGSSAANPSESIVKTTKDLLIFITPTLINPDGTRFHSEEETARIKASSTSGTNSAPTLALDERLTLEQRRPPRAGVRYEYGDPLTNAALADRIPSQDIRRQMGQFTTNRIKAQTLLQDAIVLYEAHKWDEAEARLLQAGKLDLDYLSLKHYLELVHERRAEEAIRAERADYFEAGGTNSKFTSKEWQSMKSKLDRIIIEKVEYDGLPLTEVLEGLSEKALVRDPDRTGINFMFDHAKPTVGGGIDPATGLPIAAPESPDITTIPIRIIPELHNMRLADVLDTITKSVADPNVQIRYSIEEYAVIFSLKAIEQERLFTRMFHIDPNTFVQDLANVAAVEFGAVSTGGGGAGGGGSNIGARVSVTGATTGTTGSEGGLAFSATVAPPAIVQAAVINFFQALGVNLSGNAVPPRSVFWNDRKGTLLVHASAAELELVAQAMEAMNRQPPAINFKTKFVELDEWDFPGHVFTPEAVGIPVGRSNLTQIPPASASISRSLPVFNSVTESFSAVLINPELKTVLGTLDQQPGVKVLNAPEVTTEPGRQAQVMAEDGTEVLTNENEIENLNEFGNSKAAAKLPFGPTLDAVAYVSADEFSVRLTALPTVSRLNDKRSVKLPRTATIWDGQTLVMGDIEGPAAQASGHRKWLLTFITPTLVNHNGTRINSDEEMPWTTNSPPLMKPTVRTNAPTAQITPSGGNASSPPPSASKAEQLQTRTFHVDPNTFVQGLTNMQVVGSGTIPTGGGTGNDSASGLIIVSHISDLAVTNGAIVQPAASVRAAVINFFHAAGVDLSATTVPPRLVFWNDRNGTIMVRATPAELELVAQAFEAMNWRPPEINLKAKFVELDEWDFPGHVFTSQVIGISNVTQLPPTALLMPGFPAVFRPQLTNSITETFSAVLIDPESKAALQTLEQQRGVNILSAPEVTTESGRRAQLLAEETTGVLTNKNPKTAVNLPFGPALDTLAEVFANEFSVRLAVTATVSRLLDKPSVVLPRMQFQQLALTLTIGDRHTLVMGGVEGPDGQASGHRKWLLVFVTPTLINPDGTLFHSDEERPWAGKVPPSIKPTVRTNAPTAQIVPTGAKDISAPTNTPKGEQLQTRTFHVDPRIFSQALSNVAAVELGAVSTRGGNFAGGGGGGLLVARVAVTGANTGGGTNLATATNASASLVRFFQIAGVDLSSTATPPRTVLWADLRGTLLVRAMPAELAKVAKALEAMNENPPAQKAANESTPMINLKVKFVEIDNQAGGFNLLLGGVPMSTNSLRAAASSPTGNSTTRDASVTLASSTNAVSSTNSDAVVTSELRNSLTATNMPNFSGILTDPQVKLTLRALEQRQGFNVLTPPEGTAIDGHKAVIASETFQTIVTATALPASNNLVSTSQRFGPRLEVTPFVSADGHLINLSLLYSNSLFLGYDQPTNQTGRAQSDVVPLPHFLINSTTNTLPVPDGQTAVLVIPNGFNYTFTGRDGVPVLGDIPALGRLFRSTTTTTNHKNLLIFITPTLINPDGTRVHPAEENAAPGRP